MPFERAKLKQVAGKLAASGIFIGTSSRKYEGWFGQLYFPARYEYRGKVAKTRFERDCLSQYAELFEGAAERGEDGQEWIAQLHE